MPRKKNPKNGHITVLAENGALEEEKIRQSGVASGHLHFLHKTPGEQGFSSNWQLPYTDKFTRRESNRGIDRRLATIQITKFKRDKTEFEYFWAAFTT